MKTQKPQKSSNLNKRPQEDNFLKRFSNILQNLLKTITSIIILIVIILIIFLGYKNFKSYSVIIEPFNVPSAIEKEGFNKRVMSNKLIDQINYIRASHKQKQNTDNPIFSPSWTEKDDIKIPGVGISFGYILGQIAMAFGCKTDTISNDAFIENNKLKITTRLNNKNSETFAQNINEDLDRFLLRIAEYVSKYTQPTQLAAYYYTNNKYTDALLTIQSIIGAEPKSDDSLAYVIWGDVLLKKDNDKNGAIEKYKKAIELNPKNYQAYSDWGNVLYEQRKYSLAIEKYKKAIELAPKIFAPNLNLALAYEKTGELDKATEQYKKILHTIDTAPSAISINLARAYAAQGEEEKAVEAIAEAVSKDESLKESIKKEQKFKTLEASPSFQEVIK